MQSRTVVINAKSVGEIQVCFSGKTVTITTNRLRFMSFNQFHPSVLAKNFYGVFANPENVKMYCEGKPWSQSRIKAYVREHTAKWNQGNRYAPFVVNEKETAAYIGNLGVYYPVDTYENVGRGHHNVAEIGYILDPKHHGKGYGTELAIVGKKYIKLLAREAALRSSEPVPAEVTASSHPGNPGSKRILENVLQNREDVIFLKHHGNPRLMFFKPIKIKPVNGTQDVAELNQMDLSTPSRKTK